MILKYIFKMSHIPSLAGIIMDSIHSRLMHAGHHAKLFERNNTLIAVCLQGSISLILRQKEKAGAWRFEYLAQDQRSEVGNKDSYLFSRAPALFIFYCGNNLNVRSILVTNFQIYIIVDQKYSCCTAHLQNLFICLN